MSKVIESSMNGLLNPQHDSYWDAPITRREVQEAVNALAINDKRLAMQNDTSNIVLNMLCEHLKLTREQIDIWVAQKKEIMEKIKAGHAQAEASANLVKL